MVLEVVRQMVVNVVIPLPCHVIPLPTQHLLIANNLCIYYYQTFVICIATNVKLIRYYQSSAIIGIRFQMNCHNL